MSEILVVNPNSTGAVTEAIDRAAEPFRAAGGPEIRAVTNRAGPPGIQSQGDADGVVPHLRAMAADSNADALVLACFSDPGLHVLREDTGKPVIGIAEAGLLTALTLGERVGVLAILARSVPRHLRYVRQMGLDARFAGDRPVDLEVVELADPVRTRARLLETGRELRDRDGADVLVLGCAGMADQRPALTQALGMPVVEPVQAAIGMAVASVMRGW